MTTLTKILLVAAGAGAVIYTVNKLAPVQKNPFSQVIDSASNLINSFKGTAAKVAQPSVPTLSSSGDAYPVQDAAIADGRGYSLATRNASVPADLNAPQKTYLGVSGSPLASLLS